MNVCTRRHCSCVGVAIREMGILDIQGCVQRLLGLWVPFRGASLVALSRVAGQFFGVPSSCKCLRIRLVPFAGPGSLRSGVSGRNSYEKLPWANPPPTPRCVFPQAFERRSIVRIRPMATRLVANMRFGESLFFATSLHSKRCSSSQIKNVSHAYGQTRTCIR